MQRNLVRIGILITGVAMAILAVAFFFRWPLVANIWPWTGYYSPRLSPLSYYFLSSIALAIAAPTLWIALSNKIHAAAPGAINLLLAFVGISIFMAQGYLADTSNYRLLVGALLFAGVAVSSVVVYLLGRKMPIHDMRPLPTPVRLSFFVFIIALIVVGGALILKTPNVLPWNVSVEGSVVYGWIFLGASAYFIFAVLNPRWENAAGQLMGFLAYDVVLILPFLRELGTVAPQYRLQLIVYTAVVVYSALLAIYYLFINRGTRIIGSPETAIPVEAEAARTM